jgi:hypothetical protein
VAQYPAGARMRIMLKFQQLIRENIAPWLN